MLRLSKKYVKLLHRSIFWNIHQYCGKLDWPFNKATDKHFISSFAEWFHAIVHGSPGKPPGGCQVSS